MTNGEESKTISEGMMEETSKLEEATSQAQQRNFDASYLNSDIYIDRGLYKCMWQAKCHFSMS